MRSRRKPKQELQRILRCLLILPLLICRVPAFAQTGPTIVGGGYRNPDTFQVAGGQVITIFLRNVQTLLPLDPLHGGAYRFVVASSVPLPTSLAGFSAHVDTTSGGDVVSSYPASIFAVQQLPIYVDTRPNPPEPPATPEAWVTAVTLQIPFTVGPQPIGHSPVTYRYNIVASEGKGDSTSVQIDVELDSIHFVTACDRIGIGNGYNLASLQAGAFCAPIATHLDGTFIGEESPAKPGEVIVLYAYGLGLTSPDAPPAGSPAPVPAPQVKNPLRIQFDFRPSAGPSIPEVDPKDTSLSPILFAGLAPGQVGLYQINVKLPDPFPVVARCGGSISNFTGNVPSNLTINISGAKSFDGAQICVAPGQ
jgi:hypothetical protein